MDMVESIKDLTSQAMVTFGKTELITYGEGCLRNYSGIFYFRISELLSELAPNSAKFSGIPKRKVSASQELMATSKDRTNFL